MASEAEGKIGVPGIPRRGGGKRRKKSEFVENMQREKRFSCMTEATNKGEKIDFKYNPYNTLIKML